MKTPQQMTRKDYEALGFKSGIEIHQQLKTRQKLFCRCTAQYLHKQPSATLLRHMRPTLS